MKKVLHSLMIAAVFAIAGFDFRAGAVLILPGPTNNTSGLVVWLPLDEGSGTATADGSGNNNGGTLNNSATWTPGIINNGVSCSSSTSDYVGVSGAGSAVGGTASATLCGWIKSSSTFAFGFEDTVAGTFGIQGTGGKVYYQVINGPVNYPNCPFALDGNWHYFALVYDGSKLGLSRVTAYIDGIVQPLTPGGIDPPATLSSSLGSLTVARILSTPAYTTQTSDDIRLYNRALSYGEITNQYQWPTGTRVMPSVKALAGSVTYYIDYSAGSDSNNGLTTNAPWQRHPYMLGFAGTYTHHPGDQFIFRGGVIWPSNCFCMILGAGGATGNSDYYGVNSNWFSGSSFTRPIFDGGHWAPGIVYIPYTGPRCVDFDSLEMRAVNCAQFGEGLVFLIDSDNVTLTNCWLHDWRLTNSLTGDTAHGGFMGQYNGGYMITNIILDHCEISNPENASAWNGQCVTGAGIVNYCNIHDNGSAIVFAQDVNHCTIYNISYGGQEFDPAFHLNGFYMDNGAGNPNLSSGTPMYFRNSLIYNVSGGANMAYPNIEKEDCYIYNNVFYGVMSAQLAVNIDPYDYGGTGTVYSCYVYNNTFANYWTNSVAIHFTVRPGIIASNLYFINNHVLGVGSILTDANPSECVNATITNNLVQSVATAAAQGYTFANAYAPINATASTVGQGANVMATVFNCDIRNHARPSGGWDVGAYQYNYAPNAWSAALRVVSNP